MLTVFRFNDSFVGCLCGQSKSKLGSQASGHSTKKKGCDLALQLKRQSSDNDDEELPEELQHLDKELVKKIENEIIESGDTVAFDDIAGLEDAKQTVQEVVCWPMKRPDLFTGLRRAPNGLLLYGPPGTSTHSNLIGYNAIPFHAKLLHCARNTLNAGTGMTSC